MPPALRTTSRNQYAPILIETNNTLIGRRTQCHPAASRTAEATKTQSTLAREQTPKSQARIARGQIPNPRDQIPHKTHSTLAREQTPNPRPASVERARGGELQHPSNPSKSKFQKEIGQRNRRFNARASKTPNPGPPLLDGLAVASSAEKIACGALPPATRLAPCRS